MKYQIISATSISDLIERVNKVISQGWKPPGGVAVVIEESGTARFLQAVLND